MGALARIGQAVRALRGAAPKRVPAQAVQRLDSPLAAAFYQLDRQVRGVTRAHYDAGASSPRLVDFSSALDVGPNEALRESLVTIRSRVRFEMRQNGLAKGMGRTYANVLVHRGPRLKVQSEHADWNTKVELAFARWATSCGYVRGRSMGQQMHLGARQFFPCGEYFKVPRWDESAPTVNKLRFLMLRPDRIESPAGEMGDGVKTDADGKPVHYWVKKTDPDNLNNNAWAESLEYMEVPASLMVHVFLEDDPIQFRGEPWLAQALNVFHKLRRVDEGEMAAIELANKFAAFLKNTMPEFAQEADILLPSTMDLEDGTVTTLPVGYEPVAVKPEHPANRLSEFRRDQLAAAGRGVSMPVNAVTGDSSRHNFASARFDGLLMTTDAEVVRSYVENADGLPTFNMWLAVATRLGEVPYPPSAYTLHWLWKQNEAHTDPNKAAAAQSKRLQNATSTVGGEVLAKGEDDGAHFDSLVEEVERFRAAGLRHPMDAKVQQPAAQPAQGASREQLEELVEDILSEKQQPQA